MPSIPGSAAARARAAERADEHLCDTPRQLGINVDGGYASHVLVPHPRYLIDATGIDAALAGSYMCSGLTAYQRHPQGQAVSARTRAR